jgi:alpha-1,6-mannosyltransferase
MKIVDLCEFYSERGGGVRSYLTRQGKAAELRGHELIVVAPGPKDEVVVEPGARIIRYRAPRMPYDATYHVPWRLDVMRRVVREVRPDVVQVSSPYLPAWVAHGLKGVPVRAYFYHSDPIGCYVRPTLRRLLPERLAQKAEHRIWGWQRAVSRSSDVTIVAGHWLERLLKQQGCQRVVTVPFGINRAELGQDRASTDLRAELLGPLAGDPKATLLLITGRLAADKRQAMLVEAIVLLARRRPVALVCLGDGPERARLEQLARALPMATFLSFTKDRSEYAAILASVDVLVHGSLCETFGFVVAETLSSGTPVVVPNSGGAVALVDSSCAEIYPVDATTEQVADTIDALLHRDRELLARAALRAGQAVPAEQQHFDDLFALYGRLRGAPDPRAAVVSSKRYGVLSSSNDRVGPGE